MSRVAFACPMCRESIFAAPRLEGRAAPCPKCGVHVPAWPPPVPSAPLPLPVPVPLPLPPPAPVPRPVPVPPPVEIDYVSEEGRDGGEEPEPESYYEPEPRMRRRSGSPISDFLTFRLMLTPFLIQVVFWLGTLVCLIMGLRVIASSFDGPADRGAADFRDADRFEVEPSRTADKAKAKRADARPFSAGTFASGLAILILGPTLLRLYCELMIVIFKIHDELKTANDRSRYRG